MRGFSFDGLRIPAFVRMTRVDGSRAMATTESLAGFFHFQFEPDFGCSVEEQPQGIKHDGQTAPGGGSNYGGDERVFWHATYNVDGFLAPAFEGIPFCPYGQQQGFYCPRVEADLFDGDGLVAQVARYADAQFSHCPFPLFFIAHVIGRKVVIIPV